MKVDAWLITLEITLPFILEKNLLEHSAKKKGKKKDCPNMDRVRNRALLPISYPLEKVDSLWIV